jgi:short-subunit dehydrogenase
MTRRFDGQTAFITGASAGIGAALARRFAQEGARVALAARRKDKLAGLAEQIVSRGGEPLPLECDVTDRAAIDAAVAETVSRFGGIDLVVANAGFGVNGIFTKLTTDDYRRQFDVNVFGLIDTLYATLPELEKTQGRIGLVASVLGHLATPATSAYNASKFAVVGLSDSIWYELAERGVSVTCVCPGLIATDFRTVDNRNRAHADWRDPAPDWLAMPADTCARKMIDAMYRRKPHVVITKHGKLMVGLARHLPRLTRLILRQSSRGRLHEFERRKRGGEEDGEERD